MANLTMCFIPGKPQHPLSSHDSPPGRDNRSNGSNNLLHFFGPMSQELAVLVLERLLAHPSLKANLQFVQLQKFIQLTQRLWLEIVPPGSSSRPVMLPAHITGFLGSVLDLASELVQLCWHAFADLAEAAFLNPDQCSLDDSFRLHAQEYKLGMKTLLFATLLVAQGCHSSGAETIGPPVTLCPQPSCGSHKLGEPSIVESRLYTLKRGILPVFSKSLYCRSRFKALLTI